MEFVVSLVSLDVKSGRVPVFASLSLKLSYQRHQASLRRVELGDQLIRHASCRECTGVTFELAANVVYVYELLPSRDTHGRPSVGDHNDQVPGLELAQCLPHWSSAHPEPFAQFVLGKA